MTATALIQGLSWISTATIFASSALIAAIATAKALNTKKTTSRRLGAVVGLKKETTCKASAATHSDSEKPSKPAAWATEPAIQSNSSETLSIFATILCFCCLFSALSSVSLIAFQTASASTISEIAHSLHALAKAISSLICAVLVLRLLDAAPRRV